MAQKHKCGLADVSSVRRWSIAHKDEASGQVEGIATTLLMRYKDDFVIRITEMQGTGECRVDMRSKSRMGKVCMLATGPAVLPVQWYPYTVAGRCVTGIDVGGTVCAGVTPRSDPATRNLVQLPCAQI